MKIILAVCGSISAYKAYELLRSYIKLEIEVKMILTKGALEFVNPNIFKALGAQEVYLANDDFSEKEIENILHIDLVKWCDRIIIAPASANTIAKMASGICDDLLTSVILASNKDIFIYPAMNTLMLNNQITQNNLKKLSSLKNIFVHATSYGELACKDVGEGKLPEVETILNSSLLINLNWNKKVVLINTGATIAPLDPVRYLTTPSSGKTGIELAKAFLQAGYKVKLVCGYGVACDNLDTIPNLFLYKAKTTNEMLFICSELFSECDIYISSAAISDIKFEFSKDKLKKKDFSAVIPFTQDTDVLKEVTKKKKRQIVVGFAAETELNIKKLIEKKESKNMDLLIANLVSSGINSKAKGFGQDSNDYTIFDGENISNHLHITKKELSIIIKNKVEIHAQNIL